MESCNRKRSKDILLMITECSKNVHSGICRTYDFWIMDFDKSDRIRDDIMVEF